jgi:hypothetical protein
MHTLLKVTMTDLPAANAAVSDGRIKKIFEQVSKIISPEMTFFYSEQGNRTAIMVFDLKDSAQIPQISEPFFTQLNAMVEFFPAMDTNEMVYGIDAWNKEAENYTSLS